MNLPNEPEWLAIVREKVETLRYGVVQIVIHDSKVTLIERTEKMRLAQPENFQDRPDTLEENQAIAAASNRSTGARP